MPTSDNYTSYPTIFRPTSSALFVGGDGGALPGAGHSFQPASDSDLPVIDLDDLDREGLDEACTEWGIFRVINHGIPEGLLRELLDLANEFFSQSFDSKQGSVVKPMLYFWGTPALTKSGTVNQTGTSAENRNWLEGLNVPLDKPSSGFSSQDPLLQTFSSLLAQYGAHQTRIAQTLFNAVAELLDIPPSKSRAAYLSPATGILRVYRYLRCPNADQRRGIMEHTDSSLLSILHQDQVGGLQFYKNNKWFDVEPIHDTLVVNLGDMMQAISNDRYKSVQHRVRASKQKERISMGYFVFPAEDAVIRSSNYKPFTYTEFQARNEVDVKALGNKVGLPRFRVNRERMALLSS